MLQPDILEQRFDLTFNMMLIIGKHSYLHECYLNIRNARGLIDSDRAGQSLGARARLKIGLRTGERAEVTEAVDQQNNEVFATMTQLKSSLSRLVHRCK